MKDKTQVWLESNCSMDDYVEVKPSNKIFNYFINKDIKKVDKKFCNEYNNDDENRTIVQQRIANFLLKNGSSPSNVLNLHLYVDQELTDYYEPDSDTLNENEDDDSYTPIRLEDLLKDDDDVCSLTSDIYLILETSKNKDFIIKLQTTCYDHCEIAFEEIELETII